MKKILIIEDHADMRELLTWQIELMGFAALAASRAAKDCKRLKAKILSLIILDIMMPGMDGWEAARELKANAATKDIPILGRHGVVSRRRSQDLHGLRLQWLHRQALYFSRTARKGKGTDSSRRRHLSPSNR